MGNLTVENVEKLSSFGAEGLVRRWYKSRLKTKPLTKHDMMDKLSCGSTKEYVPEAQRKGLIEPSTKIVEVPAWRLDPISAPLLDYLDDRRHFGSNALSRIKLVCTRCGYARPWGLLRRLCPSCVGMMVVDYAPMFGGMDKEENRLEPPSLETPAALF